MHREEDLYLEWIFLAAANPSRFLLNILKKEFHDWNFIQKTCSGQLPPVFSVCRRYAIKLLDVHHQAKRQFLHH